MAELLGRVALVTGASRGIGRSIAVALARAGCDVVVNYRERAEDAAETVQQVEAVGRRARLARADVSDAAQVARIVPGHAGLSTRPCISTAPGARRHLSARRAA
jgi:NAD(P)-dependent dehydrogenase (short-subunit alcohol dehydrogenase family)